MYKILITGSIHETGLEILYKEQDIEIQYAPDLALAEMNYVNADQQAEKYRSSYRRKR